MLDYYIIVVYLYRRCDFISVVFDSMRTRNDANVNPNPSIIVSPYKIGEAPLGQFMFEVILLVVPA